MKTATLRTLPSVKATAAGPPWSEDAPMGWPSEVGAQLPFRRTKAASWLSSSKNAKMSPSFDETALIEPSGKSLACVSNQFRAPGQAPPHGLQVNPIQSPLSGPL